MKAARQQQFVTLLTDALSKMLGADVKVEVVTLDAMPEKVSVGTEPKNRDWAKDPQPEKASVGTEPKYRDRTKVGYMVFHDGKPVFESLDAHRECLMESVERAHQVHKALNSVAVALGRAPEPPLNLDIRAVYAE